MLYLLFEAGGDRYALETGCIDEVLPLVDVARLPQAPRGVAGMCTVRGAPIPVFDVSEALCGRPAARRLSTRIVLVRVPDGAGGVRRAGLLAERATSVVRREPADFVGSGLEERGVPWLGRVAPDGHSFVHHVDIAKLLSGAPSTEWLGSLPDERP